MERCASKTSCVLAQGGKMLGAIIGLPVWENVNYRFVQTLQGIAPPMNYSTSTVMVANKRIDHARNEIVAAALRAGAEHVFFLDSDVLAPPGAFQQLLLRARNNNHKIVSGVYWSKSNPCYPLIFHEPGCGSNMDWRVGDYIKAPYAIGMGLVLIHTDVFRAISDSCWYTIDYGLTIDKETGATMASSMTEDLPFCQRALDAGFDIWVDTGIQAGHLVTTQDYQEVWKRTFIDVFRETQDPDLSERRAYEESAKVQVGQIFGLNESMPQAQGRSPADYDTLYIGEMLSGGEPGDVLAPSHALKPTWIGPPEIVPVDKVYGRVCVKDVSISPDAYPTAVENWVNHLKGGAELEILSQDPSSFDCFSGHVYSPAFLEQQMANAGLTEIRRAQTQNYWHIKGRKRLDSDPVVSIVILAHDQPEMTGQCVVSLREKTKSEVPYEIIVVDNGSDPPLPSLGDRQVRCDENLSYGQGMTAGIKESKAPYVLLLNNDTVCIQEDWLDALLLRIRGKGNVAAVGPKQIHPNGTVYHSEIGFTEARVPYHPTTGVSHDHMSVQVEKAVLALNFGVVLVRRQLFDAIPFDERFGDIGNYEDIDWCLRAREMGLTLIYTPAVEWLHFGGQTQGQDIERSKLAIEVNRVKFVEKWKDADEGLFVE